MINDQPPIPPLRQLCDERCAGGLAVTACYTTKWDVIHTMKGLEKDIIFILGFSEGTFPDYRANSHAQVEEERNTAFVAVTRARRWLFISHPRNRLMPWGSSQFQRPSRFLLEMGLITHQ